MGSKIFKLSLVVAFLFAVSLLLYVSPYMALNQLFKAAGDSSKHHIISHFTDKEAIKHNILKRYNITLFFGLDTEAIAPEKQAEKVAIEESIKYAVNLLITDENISELVLALKNKKLDDMPIDVIYTYDGFNEFKIFVKKDKVEQEIIFTRYNLMFWKITDIKFPIDPQQFY